MKAVLMSIRPEWCKKILSGEKTVEIRKTRPALMLEAFQGLYLLYCDMERQPFYRHPHLEQG